MPTHFVFLFLKWEGHQEERMWVGMGMGVGDFWGFFKKKKKILRYILINISCR